MVKSFFFHRVDFRRKWCHATQINAPCSALHQISPTFGQEQQEREGLIKCQNIFFITDQENAVWSDYGEEFHFMYGFLFSNGYSIDWVFLMQQEKNKIFRMRTIIWLERVGNKRPFFPTSWGTYKSSKHCFITKYRRHETSKYTKHNIQETEQSSENRLSSSWVANCI